MSRDRSSGLFRASPGGPQMSRRNMLAAMGVAAGVEFAKTGKKASGYVDTGVTLIAGKSVAGVDSKDTKTGADLCWGKK